MAPLTRICLTGPESTGKSTLALRLSRERGAPLVPEYAREYALQAGRPLTEQDVEPIARGWIARADRIAANVTGLLILDTDLISTVVYARWYYGHCPGWIEEEAYERRADLYLLLDTDIPWHPDPVRDAGSPEEREELFDAFRATLDEMGTTWRIVSGERDTLRLP